MLTFLKSQWKGMVALLAVALVGLNLWVLAWGSVVIAQRSGEAHVVFEQLRAILEQQKPPAKPAPKAEQP